MRWSPLHFSALAVLQVYWLLSVHDHDRSWISAALSIQMWAMDPDTFGATRSLIE